MAITKRHDFVALFDVENGNPNGDPDAGNMPRLDPETGIGLVTDVCIKRKIRNYVELAYGETIEDGKPRFNIYIQEGVLLNDQHKLAYEALGEKVSDKLPKDVKKAKELTNFMCQNFFDIRAFGAVMSTKVNCGQVRGPVQINFAKSIDPIMPQELTITRIAITKEKENANGTHEMGRKQIVPYGLYRVEGYVSASLADSVTGFDETDLAVLWESIINMFEHDHSASRGKMATRKLFVFEHESKLGNAPSHMLFDLIDVHRKDINKPARKFSDYLIEIATENIPQEVKLIEKL